MDREGDTEVGDERAPVLQQDVLGLDVAVDHALAVRVVQRTRHLPRETHGVADRELSLALEACQLHPRLNSDLLICAALVHDLGKTREFTYGAEIGLSDEGRLLGHVVLGQRLLDRFELPDDRRLAVMHCVLGHHGADALPGRRFGSAEALALYRLNALDASVKGALEHGLP